MITPLFVGFKIRFQKIREKEELQHQENNDQFDDDNTPELFTNSHIFKPLVIKQDDIH
jgi:hypothetical protein